MTRIETAEQARVWLATYEAVMWVGAKVRSAFEAADEAVEAWRERVGPPNAEDVAATANLLTAQADSIERLRKEREALEFLRDDAANEAKILRAERDAARTLLDDVRTALKASKVPDAGLPAAVAMLRETLDGVRDALPPGEGTLVEGVKRLVAECNLLLAANEALRRERDCAQIKEKSLRQEVREERGRLAEVGDALAGVSPEFSPACDIAKQVKALVAERNSLHKDLAAAREALRFHTK